MKKILITESQDKIIQEAIAENKLLPRLPLHVLEDIRNGNNPFSACPSLMQGSLERLLAKAYKATIDEFSDDITSYSETEVINALSKLTTKIIKKEEPIRQQLEALCLKIVNESFCVPKEGVRLGCELVNEIPDDGKLRVEPNGSQDVVYDDVAAMENNDAEIEKRKLLCALITGMASKLSESLRKKYIGEIFDIDEELPHLYSKAMKINDYLIFATTPKISEKRTSQGGYSNVKLGTDIVPTEITAYGIMFPIVLFETIKGCLELFISHGLPDDIHSAKSILEQADVLVNDPWYMRLGTAIYKYDVSPKYVPTFLMNISQLPVNEFFSASKEIIAGTRKGETIIQNMISDAQYSDDYDAFQGDLIQKQTDKNIVTDDCFSEQELEEAAYPSNFNMEEFKSLTSFAARVKYCGERLQRLGSGSSRIVYLIDNNTVLKLAKNQKGVAQNEVEGGDWYLRKLSLFPDVYDVDENYLWIEMQLARPAKAADFRKLLGYDFQTICAWVDHLLNGPVLLRSAGSIEREQIFKTDKFIEMYNNDDKNVFSQIENYINTCGGYGAAGDFKRMSSWGVIKDETGHERLVVIDYGLTEDVFKKYYQRYR